MTALMEDSGVAQVFAALRAQAMGLPAHERDDYLASLAVEEAAMAQAFAAKSDVDLWSVARARRPLSAVPDLVPDAAAPEEPTPSRVWHLSAPSPRPAGERYAVSSIPGPRREWTAPAVAGASS